MITLKTLHKASAQEVFDQVVTHLLKQNKRSIDVGGIHDYRCLYRGPNGLQCAAGCLIADDEYQKGIECKDWESLLAEGFAPDTHFKLIRSLQVVHDEVIPSRWKEALRVLANEYKGPTGETISTGVLDE